MRINNISSMTATRYLNYHQQRVANSIYRVSTGKRISSAADDPAGMAIAQKFKARIRELAVHIRNAELKQAELDAVYDQGMLRQGILSRLREIAVRVSSDTLSQDEKGILMTDFFR